MTDRRVDRDNTVDHADAVIGASKNASDAFIVVGAVLWRGKGVWAGEYKGGVIRGVINIILPMS
jgi:hypothetical protein